MTSPRAVPPRTARPDPIAAYAPRLARAWVAEASGLRHRRVHGTLLCADISGFTRLSERLASRGRAGAEEVVTLVGLVMTALVEEIDARGGDVLVFGGDALVVLFGGAGAAPRAARTGAAIRRWFATHDSVATSAGRVALRVSIGVASGPVDLVLAGGDERGVFVVGPTATTMGDLERLAEPGEVLVDAATAAELDPAWLGAARLHGRLLRRTSPLGPAPDPPAPPVADVTPFVPAALRRFVLGADNGAPGAAGLESEHRIATVAFVRAGGLDVRFGRPETDPEVASAAADLDALLRTASASAARHGVTLLGTDIANDGATLFLAAGAPATTGEDEERMIRTLRAILAAPEAARLALRAGVNRGPVFAGDVGAPHRRTYTAMGDTTNLAARMAARASPGELLATGEVVARTATEFASEALDAFTPKGKHQAVVPYRVGEPTGHHARTPALLPLEGRTAELDLLRAALDAAAAGRGSVVEVVGEAGSGKSRLLQELRSLVPGASRFVVRFVAADAATPYAALRGPLRELAGIPRGASAEEAGAVLAAWARDLAPAVAPWLPLVAIPFGAAAAATREVEELAPSFRRARLHEAVGTLLAAALAPPVLVELEDVHWADEASLALAASLAEGPGAGQRLVSVLRRPTGDAFPAAVAARIDLAPLDAAAVARLASTAAGVALSDEALRAIVGRAAGNPLFARELAVAAAEQGSTETLPDRLEVLLASRIDRLDARGRALLRRAAVGGRTIELDLLAEVLAADATDVRDLALWATLDEFVGWAGPSRLRFRHDLIRDAAYEGLAHARRIGLHARFAEAIERRSDPAADDVAGTLAMHYARGGRPDRAFVHARRAGDSARSRYANVDAAAQYRRALDAAAALRDVPASDLLDVAEALGDVAELAGRYDESRHAYERARALARGPGGDALARARLARKSGIVCERTGRYGQALAWYGRGRRALAAGTRGIAAEDPVATAGAAAEALRIRLDLDTAGIRFRQGRYSACVRGARRAAAAAERAGERSLLAHAYYLLHAAYGDLGSPEAARVGPLALPIFEELGDLVGQGNVLNNLGIEAYFEGRWDDALELYARSKDAKTRAGDVANAATQSNNEAEILSDQGRLAEAEKLLRDALRVWSAASYEIGIALATSNLGRAAARAGRHDDGLALLADAVARFERMGAAGYEDETRARVAECLVLAGRGDEAGEVATATLARVRREAATSVLAAQLERTLGWAALQRGDGAGAAAHFDESLRQARALHADFEVALTLRARLAAAWDDRVDAGTREREAREADAILGRLGVVAVPELPLPR